MPVGSHCRRAACTVQLDETLRSVAQRMEKEGVGSVVVVEEGRPVGVLTDRDLALRVVADRRDAAATKVVQVLGGPPTVIPAAARLSEASRLMSRQRVRRLPVVDEDGAAVGVISADDIVRLLADEIGGLAQVAGAQLPPIPEDRPATGERREVRSAEHYHGDVVCLRADADVRAVADLMKSRAVGSVVLTGGPEEADGIVTDRDIAVRVVAAGLHPDATPAHAIMSAPLVTAEATQPLQEVVEKMRSVGVRRIPILSEGRPVGMVSYDDLLVAFGRELAQLGDAARREVLHEQRQNQAEELRETVEVRLRELGARAAGFGGEALETLREELDDLWQRIRQR